MGWSSPELLYCTQSHVTGIQGLDHTTHSLKLRSEFKLTNKISISTSHFFTTSPTPWGDRSVSFLVIQWFLEFLKLEKWRNYIISQKVLKTLAKRKKLTIPTVTAAGRPGGPTMATMSRTRTSTKSQEAYINKIYSSYVSASKSLQQIILIIKL